MNFAVIQAGRRGEADTVLARLAERLSTRGFRIVGTVVAEVAHADRHPCDMAIRVLPNGPTIGISQSLGREARGCRLDPGALETAVAATTARLNGDADLLIVNKFGKNETEGRGFRDAIADALGRGIPVVCAVSGLNRPALETFAEGLLTELPADTEALETWFLAQLQGAAA